MILEFKPKASCIESLSYELHPQPINSKFVWARSVRIKALFSEQIWLVGTIVTKLWTLFTCQKGWCKGHSNRRFTKTWGFIRVLLLPGESQLPSHCTGSERSLTVFCRWQSAQTVSENQCWIPEKSLQHWGMLRGEGQVGQVSQKEAEVEENYWPREGDIMIKPRMFEGSCVAERLSPAFCPWTSTRGRAFPGDVWSSPRKTTTLGLKSGLAFGDSMGGVAVGGDQDNPLTLGSE